MGYFDGIKECEDLVSLALESVTEPTTIYDQSPRNSGTLRFVAIKFDEHIFFCYFVTLLLFIPVFVVNPYQTTREGEYFAKGDENRVMDLAQWWAEEARGKHHAPEGAQCSSGDELEVFHELGSYFPLITLICTDVSRIRVYPCNPWELFKLSPPKSDTPR